MTLDPRPCRLCGQPELPDYPHRHDQPVRSSWDPMPARPERLYCGSIDLNAYWTEPDWRPSCCMVHVVTAEWRAELPERMHPTSEAVPTRLEPIPREPGNLAGPTIDVPDRGALGGWPWASEAHRRFGGVTMIDGEQTLNAGDYRIFPWAYVLERRLPGHCRRRHVGHPDRWPEHTDGELCGDLMRAIIAHGIPPERIAVRRRIPAERLRDVLEDALRWSWRRVSETINEIELGRRRRPSPAESPAA